MMRKGTVLFIITVTYISACYCDVYLQSPRGSNNRLNERSANRRNANRAFDSQNNNRGGYNVGDKTNSPFRDEKGQYHMKYFQSDETGKTKYTIEWTNQHGCGGNEDTDPHKLNCNIVLQYMCQPDSVTGVDKIRNGLNTNTPAFTTRSPQTIEKETKYGIQALKAGNAQPATVYQEPWEWYDKCRNRLRNKGLFTADQNLKGQESIYTRQNSQGTRRGYECPEERDYYPYWHPTPWKDIAVLAHNESFCSYYDKHSFNVEEKYECVEKRSDGSVRHNSRYNNEKDCTTNGGSWRPFVNYLEKATQFKTEAECKGANGNQNKVKYIWGRPLFGDKEECLVALSKPHCEAAAWSRVNHHGNGREGVPLRYSWTLPHFPSGQSQRCIFRIRYNISTDDYDPYNTFSTNNKDLNKGTVSPVNNDPEVNIGMRNIPLRLAINTAQFGRTFQDRSHVFHLMPRTTELKGKTIHNVNVRGKRGNIVQVYPAVEYDFIPTRIKIKDGELIHFQWTGSNTHNNGNPAGDGQAGDAGEGTGGTDRNNIMEMMSPDHNYPSPIERGTLFKNSEVMWTSDPLMTPAKYSSEDIAISFGSAGYFSCKAESVCQANSLEKKNAIQNQLNNAYASYPGMVLRIKRGKYYYMCTRNNSFTNRSQKGQIEVL